MHLFNPASTPRGLVLLAPGGGQDHTSPGVVARATRLTDDGYAVAVVRSLDEVPSVLADHPGPVASAPLVTAPVVFYVQSDDDLVAPDACRALFDALGSADKAMVENPGGHLDLPRTSVEESAVWLNRKLAEH